MRRRVDVANHGLSQNAASAIVQLRLTGRKRLNLLENELQRLFNAQHGTNQLYMARNARSISCPCSVRKLSGWNCTPTTGSRLCRIAMISWPPSGASAQALTTKSGESVSGRITRL